MKAQPVPMSAMVMNSSAPFRLGGREQGAVPKGGNCRVPPAPHTPAPGPPRDSQVGDVVDNSPALNGEALAGDVVVVDLQTHEVRLSGRAG